MDSFSFHLDNLAKHGVYPEEVEEAIADRHRIFEKRGEGLYFIIGRTESGRLLELVYRKLPTGVRFVFHAMDARERDRKRYQRRK